MKSICMLIFFVVGDGFAKFAKIITSVETVCTNFDSTLNRSSL